MAALDDAERPAKKGFFALKALTSPPLTEKARRDAGFYLDQVQEGVSLALPISRPMPSIGPRVHELRLSDQTGDWRVVYRIDEDVVLVVDVFKKTTGKTPDRIIGRCRRALARLDDP